MVLTMLGMLAGSIVFIYTSNADSHAYTDDKISDVKKDLNDVVDLKIETIKVDIQNIKTSVKKLEDMQVEIYKAVVNKK